jgi:hypothetical protein
MGDICLFDEVQSCCTGGDVWASPFVMTQSQTFSSAVSELRDKVSINGCVVVKVLMNYTFSIKINVALIWFESVLLSWVPVYSASPTEMAESSFQGPSYP